MADLLSAAELVLLDLTLALSTLFVGLVLLLFGSPKHVNFSIV